MSKDFLLEIGLEEMPAKYVTASSEQLKLRVTEWLKEKKLAYQEVINYSTPRRLAVVIKDLAEKQADSKEEAKGPAKKIALDDAGNWSKAALGFARSQGVDPDDFTFRDIKGIEYIYINKEMKGESTTNLLLEIKKIITDMTFPISMHWGANELRYLRPIKWLVALYGEEVIPFNITNVQTGNISRGHRFLGQDTVISSPNDYQERLLEQFVICSGVERKEAITNQIKEVAHKEGWTIPIDEELLEEVTNLVEYPTVLAGNFEKKYLELPEEILITTMKEHQRYFPVFNEQGALLDHFITVRNGDHNYLATVQRGNEKVLRARLSDADFFYQEDLKINIDDAVQKLDQIVFHEKLGTLTDKMERVQKVALLIQKHLNLDLNESDIKRVTAIYKFDLVTNIVGEFPELQGIMGEKYAILQGEKVDIAQAIREHYLPISVESALPASDLGRLLAISDKLETLVSFFCIGITPSGSADPFGLRRNSLGILRIIQANNWNLPLMEILKEIIHLEQDGGFGHFSTEDVYQEISHFIQNRLRVILQDKKIRADIIDAVVAGNPNKIPQLIERANLLNEHKADDWFRPTIESLTRVLNIARKHQAGVITDPTLFENDAEQKLFTAAKELKQVYSSMKASERLKAFINLRPVIDEYFENTLVMSDDDAIRNNRLALLFELGSMIREFAQVNEINVK
ncbi:glycine--tRNA ligase subunit beta [Listeria sp. PSOL-1]|uniref:glycine--tRNA ligase subunit beta n=1 Tax=Listeria sp. PSOL-1 TaxID=1844999 RepID=UPI0013D1E212|nr:glycine--tRNA ligase subunit beta [Listeria sp. PSOL-1]